MKIWFISDTHTYHSQCRVPDVDMVCHVGDFSNSSEMLTNIKEFYNFVEWFKELPMTKVLVAGNHDVCMRRKLFRQVFSDLEINYLHHEAKTIEGIKFFGSPLTARFGKTPWEFMVDRSKLDKFWRDIPSGTEILLTHQPAYSILDTTENASNEVEQVGCKSLYRKVMEIKPKIHAFGHIHNAKGITNSGIFQFAETKFINCSAITDRKQGLTSNGYVIGYE